MLTEGNIQYGSYLLSFDLSHMFHSNISEKLLSCLQILIFWVLIMMSIGMIFYIKINLQVKTKYFVEYFHTRPLDIIYMSLSLGVKQIIMGVLHYFMEFNYYGKIVSIMVMEICFLMVYVYLMRAYWKISNKIIGFKVPLLLNHIMPTFVRILITVTLIVSY
jgi:hypothetical protein